MRHIESFCIKPGIGSRGSRLYCFKGQVDRVEDMRQWGPSMFQALREERHGGECATSNLLIKRPHHTWYYVSSHLRARWRSKGCS